MSSALSVRARWDWAWVAVEGLRDRSVLRGGGGSRLAQGTVRATRQRTQHLARILKVAAPQQRRALARKSIGLIGRGFVIGDDHASRGRCSAFGEPPRLARLTALGPLKDRARARS